MNAIYFETHFKCEDFWSDWPVSFAIITAYATTGEIWSAEQNNAADQQLLLELERRICWLRRLTGYSPQDGHAEPGWAAELDFQTACDIGKQFHQDAIYYVNHNLLSVSYCDERRAMVEVGPFRERIHLPDQNSA